MTMPKGVYDRDRPRCGTWAAYLRHWRNGETPCERCREACRQQARYRLARRERCVHLDAGGRSRCNLPGASRLTTDVDAIDCLRCQRLICGRGGWRYERKRQPCGTWSAYKRHLRRREVPCNECTEAARLRSAARRAARKEAA
jgi:hypothetical protein